MYVLFARLLYFNWAIHSYGRRLFIWFHSAWSWLCSDIVITPNLSSSCLRLVHILTEFGLEVVISYRISNNAHSQPKWNNQIHSTKDKTFFRNQTYSILLRLFQEWRKKPKRDRFLRRLPFLSQFSSFDFHLDTNKLKCQRIEFLGNYGRIICKLWMNESRIFK